MSMRVVLTLVVLVAAAGAAQAEWTLGPRQLIDQEATEPRLWDGAAAYLIGSGGAVAYYADGQHFTIFGPDQASYEPSHAAGRVAWRNSQQPGPINDVYYWDGSSVVNLSNNTQVYDGVPSVGSNGDVIWAHNYTELYYYDASANHSYSLGVQGRFPSLYIRPDGVATYVYQHPTTYDIVYFDGTTSQVVGPGTYQGSYPSLWDGAIAWLGPGAGSIPYNVDIYFWKAGQMVKVTDDPAPGVADAPPAIWRDRVVWGRMVHGPILPFHLYFWDGQDTHVLNTTDGRYPSYQAGQVAWREKNASVSYVADLTLPGDLDNDSDVDLHDYYFFSLCFNGALELDTADYDGDLDVDLDDFEVWSTCMAGPTLMFANCERMDLDHDGDVDLADYRWFAEARTRSWENPRPNPCRPADFDDDGDIDMSDAIEMFNGFTPGS